jgi:ATP/maltotriose-dependent transcriptional regulator MalT
VAEGGRVFPKGQAAPRVKLSKRELDVLHHLAAGLSNPETAATLNLSRHTIKQHTSSVYRKLRVRNRAEAASRAQELGLLGWQSADG